MKKSILIILALVSFMTTSYSQDTTAIKRAALDYIEGFYYGDTLKIMRSIHPDLSKLGFGRNKETKEFKKGSSMTFDKAVDFSRDVANDPRWAAPEDAVMKIEILDAMEKIASVKLTLYWGVDYVLLANLDDKWMITKVVWQAY